MKQFFVCMALALLAVGCNKSDGGNGNPADPSQVNIQFTATELVIGTGTEAVVGSSVTVNYTGWLFNAAGADSKGVQFDTSIGKEPFAFGPIGNAQVITGFQAGTIGMKVGGKRRLYIPYDLAYGTTGAGSVIPPYAALVFEIELLSVT